MSKLGVLVTLNTSKLNLIFTRSVNWVSFTADTSARFCHACRKMFRCPVVKFVSNVSPAGTAPPKSPGFNKGTVKQAAFNAGEPGVAPLAPVSACDGEHPLRGTTGFVMPSEVP